MSLPSQYLTPIRTFSILTITASSINDSPQCTMCRSATSEYCSVCKSTSYCSKACQDADLPVHKLLCGVARSPLSPSGVYYVYSQPAHPIFHGVLFPASETNPCWVAYRGNYAAGEGRDRNGGNYCANPPHPAVQLLHHFRAPLAMTSNVLRSRSRPSNTLELYFTTTGPGPGYSVNRSVLTATNRRSAQIWYGPLLAVKVATPVATYIDGVLVPHQRIVPQYLDMDMIDFRDIVDLLYTYTALDINDMTNTTGVAVSTPKHEVSGVRINCPGDQALGRPRFEVVLIRATDAACRAPVSPISRLVQFPVRVSRCLPSHTAGPSHDLVNPAATDLMMGVDPAREWGFAGAEWVDPAGSVVVVREGGEPLHPQIVEALCHWCVSVLRPLFQDSLGMGREPENPMPKETVLARIVKREWECFYTGFDEWKGSVQNTWVKEIWPL